MKVVINACFGGFDITEKALRLLERTDCPHIERSTDREWFGRPGSTDAEIAAEKKRAEEFAERWPKMATPRLADGRWLSHKHRSDDAARACPRLVEVVEKLGAEANGEHAELRVVEIPDGVEFEIAEYDGKEHVAEKHQVWR